ncbi:MAG: hypothetical protein ACM33B_11470 [Pseudomonadota bacterium]
MNDALRLAEAPALHDPVAADEQLVDDPRFVLFVGPREATVQRIRLGDVAEALAEVRGRAPGRTTTWEVATTSTPGDLLERLLELGLREDESRRAAAMALRGELGTVPGVRVTRVESLDDFKTHVRITHEVFDRLDRLSEELDRIDREGAAQLADTSFVRYVAWVDDEPAGAATATFTPEGAILHSGSVLPWARGRGAYRALVAFRRAEAAARGTPTVVTRASVLSRPILRGLGFEELAEIRFLVDAE